MKSKITLIILFFWISIVYPQREFHVSVNGSPSGNGSFNNPWDLQTALTMSRSKLKAGDIVWMHQGIYNGRYHSDIYSSNPNKKILISSYPGEWAIINANVESDKTAALTVTGSHVIYQDFEVAPQNVLTRNENEEGFRRFDGIFHTQGIDCEFINLVIHGNNGLGIGSWKKTGGSMIANCIIYDNGFINSKGRGIGEGMYVQNESNAQRIIKDNIIFNNYYKGIEVWSASKKATFEYVKNVTIDNNVIFNSGLVANRTVDNIIVATHDGTGINVAKNIKITNNILYHNTDFKANEVNGDAPSLTLGYRESAAIENIEIRNNIILGRNNPVRLLYAKSLVFENNIMYGGYMHIMPINFNRPIKADFNFSNNTYFTKNSTPMLLIKEKKYGFEEWKGKFGLDTDSKWTYTRDFNLPSVIDITRNANKINEFRVVVFSKNGTDVKLDHSNFSIEKRASYTIRDVEDRNKILKSGIMDETSSIIIPMNMVNEHYTKANRTDKTLSNFGVFIVEFDL